MEPDVRVSDHDRQAVVDRLAAAVGDGLVTLDEFAEHAGRAYAAITRTELDDVTRELRLPVAVAGPAHAPAPAVERRAEAGETPKRRWVVAIMGGEDRRGRWRTGKRVGAVAFMGGVELDLRDALLDDEMVEITAWAFMGGVTIVVPEGIPVECSGFILMGGRSNRVRDVPTLPGAPIVRVKGFGMWGGIDVRSKPRKNLSTPDAAQPVAEPEAPPGLLPHLQHLQHPLHLQHLPPPPVAPQHHAGLVTIVCTDLVGSTRLSDELGDQRWRALLQDHNAIVREQLARHGGTEVKHRGDGFLCTFTSARRAVSFAVDVQDAFASYRVAHPDLPLEVRVGVHAGEVERDGHDVVGRNVSLACRLCDAATPGEVLVSAVVADLADSSSDLSFGAGRDLSLAGIERPVTARPAARR